MVFIFISLPSLIQLEEAQRCSFLSRLLLHSASSFRFLRRGDKSFFLMREMCQSNAVSASATNNSVDELVTEPGRISHRHS